MTLDPHSSSAPKDAQAERIAELEAKVSSLMLALGKIAESSARTSIAVHHHARRIARNELRKHRNG